MSHSLRTRNDARSQQQGTPQRRRQRASLGLTPETPKKSDLFPQPRQRRARANRLLWSHVCPTKPNVGARAELPLTTLKTPQPGRRCQCTTCGLFDAPTRLQEARTRQPTKRTGSDTTKDRAASAQASRTLTSSPCNTNPLHLTEVLGLSRRARFSSLTLGYRRRCAKFGATAREAPACLGRHSHSRDTG